MILRSLPFLCFLPLPLALASAGAMAATTASLPTTTPSVVTSKTITPQISDAIQKLVHDINPKAVVKEITDSPFPGIKTVVADSSVLYASDDGRYLLYGVLLDTKTKQNLTDQILGGLRIKALASIPRDDMITFSPKNPRYTVTAFTDTSCEYCEALFKNTQAYLAMGIAINYVPWPRGGMQSENLAQMKSVWCAKDRTAAYTAAMSGQPVKAATCDNSAHFPQLFALGEQLGIDGTPAIFDASGRKIGGFIPPAQMLAKLQELDKPPASVPGPTAAR